MREQAFEDERKHAWIIYAMAIVVVGVLAGYALSAIGQPTFPAASAPAATTAAPTFPARGTGNGGGTVVDEQMLQAYRAILAKDPKNLQAEVGAATLLYDARRYADARARLRG